MFDWSLHRLSADRLTDRVTGRQGFARRGVEWARHRFVTDSRAVAIQACRYNEAAPAAALLQGGGSLQSYGPNSTSTLVNSGSIHYRAEVARMRVQVIQLRIVSSRLRFTF
jgi:hypothetical protein